MRTPKELESKPDPGPPAIDSKSELENDSIITQQERKPEIKGGGFIMIDHWSN